MTFQNRNALVITRSVLFALVLREVRGRFSARRFGAFWMLFEPAVQILMILAIFSFRTVTILNVEYPVYLVTGMIPYFLMRNVIIQGMEAVSANKALFAYKQIKPLDTVFARCIIEIVIYSCIYLLFMVVMGFWFDFNMLMTDPICWVGVLAIGLIFSFSLGLLFCMLGEIIPESKPVIRMLFFPIYILSGVIFPIWLLPNEVISWLLWNPFVHIIDELRMATFQYYPDHVGVNIYYPLKVSVFLLFISLGLYRLRRFKLVAV